ncbi:hypothetical protein, partial [Kaistella antarctica]|uniref:hypothetical protein n=1 Tax=Kaistella antarctica TaxID=266748 RepID=UPI001C871D26
LPTMFYPDLEENSSRGIKSGAISMYQRSVGLYPAAFTLWLILLTKLLIIFLNTNLPLQRHPFLHCWTFFFSKLIFGQKRYSPSTSSG